MMGKFLEGHFPRKPFSSQKYCGQRCESSRNLDPGSYGHSAEFNAPFLNAFVPENNVASFIRLGCNTRPEVIAICQNYFMKMRRRKFPCQ